jgi:hypothetical protein
LQQRTQQQQQQQQPSHDKHNTSPPVSLSLFDLLLSLCSQPCEVAFAENVRMRFCTFHRVRPNLGCSKTLATPTMANPRNALMMQCSASQNFSTLMHFCYTSRLLGRWSPHQLLIVFLRKPPLCHHLVEVSPNSCGNSALGAKKVVVTIVLDDFLCNAAGLCKTRCNLGTWKLVPNRLGFFPNLIFRQHFETSRHPRQCGTMPRHARENRQIKNMHVRHLGCLGLPVPPIRIAEAGDTSHEPCIIVRAGMSPWITTVQPSH